MMPSLRAPSTSEITPSSVTSARAMCSCWSDAVHLANMLKDGERGGSPETEMNEGPSDAYWARRPSGDRSSSTPSAERGVKSSSDTVEPRTRLGACLQRREDCVSLVARQKAKDS